MRASTSSPLGHRHAEEHVRVGKRRAAAVGTNEDVENPLGVLVCFFVGRDDAIAVNDAVEPVEHLVRPTCISEPFVMDDVNQVLRFRHPKNVANTIPVLVVASALSVQARLSRARWVRCRREEAELVREFLFVLKPGRKEIEVELSFWEGAAVAPPQTG